jgi:hypothetical protein
MHSVGLDLGEREQRQPARRGERGEEATRPVTAQERGVCMRSVLRHKSVMV